MRVQNHAVERLAEALLPVLEPEAGNAEAAVAAANEALAAFAPQFEQARAAGLPFRDLGPLGFSVASGVVVGSGIDVTRPSLAATRRPTASRRPR